MSLENIADAVSFVPSRVEGMDSVANVTVQPGFIVFGTASGSQTHRFEEFARPQDNIFQRFVRRLFFRPPWPPMIGEREFCHPPADRYFRFYTEPQITVYMPKNEPSDYQLSTFYKIQLLWRIGGFETWDLS